MRVAEELKPLSSTCVRACARVCVHACVCKAFYGSTSRVPAAKRRRCDHVAGTLRQTTRVERGCGCFVAAVALLPLSASLSFAASKPWCPYLSAWESYPKVPHLHLLRSGEDGLEPTQRIKRQFRVVHL